MRKRVCNVCLFQLWASILHTAVGGWVAASPLYSGLWFQTKCSSTHLLTARKKITCILLPLLLLLLLLLFLPPIIFLSCTSILSSLCILFPGILEQEAAGWLVGWGKRQREEEVGKVGPFPPVLPDGGRPDAKADIIHAKDLIAKKKNNFPHPMFSWYILKVGINIRKSGSPVVVRFSLLPLLQKLLWRREKYRIPGKRGSKWRRGREEEESRGFPVDRRKWWKKKKSWTKSTHLNRFCCRTN